MFDMFDMMVIACCNTGCAAACHGHVRRAGAALPRCCACTCSGHVQQAWRRLAGPVEDGGVPRRAGANAAIGPHASWTQAVDEKLWLAPARGRRFACRPSAQSFACSGFRSGRGAASGGLASAFQNGVPAEVTEADGFRGCARALAAHLSTYALAHKFPRTRSRTVFRSADAPTAAFV